MKLAESRAVSLNKTWSSKLLKASVLIKSEDNRFTRTQFCVLSTSWTHTHTHTHTHTRIQGVSSCFKDLPSGDDDGGGGEQFTKTTIKNTLESNARSYLRGLTSTRWGGEEAVWCATDRDRCSVTGCCRGEMLLVDRDVAESSELFHLNVIRTASTTLGG